MPKQDHLFKYTIVFPNQGLFLGHEDSNQDNLLLQEFIKLKAVALIPGTNRYGSNDIEFIPYATNRLVEHYRVRHDIKNGLDSLHEEMDKKVEEQSYTALFMGQIPNMIPIHYLEWFIDTLLERYTFACVKPSKKTGTAQLFVPNNVVDELLQLSRTAWCDIRGVWIAKTPKGKTFFQELKESIPDIPSIYKDGRITKNPLVIDHLKNPINNQAKKPVQLQANNQRPPANSPALEQTESPAAARNLSAPAHNRHPAFFQAPVVYPNNTNPPNQTPLTVQYPSFFHNGGTVNQNAAPALLYNQSIW